MPEAASEERKTYMLSDFFEPPLLLILEALQEETGYTCMPYPEYPGPPRIGIGWYTFPGRKVIYFNPHHVKERGPVYTFPIFGHEMGHHDPELMEFQDMCQKIGANVVRLFPAMLPVKKIIKTLNNISADVFLEEKNSRGIYRDFMFALYRRALAQDFLPKEIFESHEGEFTEENFPWDKLEKPKDRKAYLIEEFSAGLILMPKFGMAPEGTFDARVHQSLADAKEHIGTIASLDKTKVGMAQKLHAQFKIFSIAAELLKDDYEKMEEQQAKSGKSLADILKDFEGILDAIEKGEIKIVEAKEEGEGEDAGGGGGGGGEDDEKKSVEVVGKDIAAALQDLLKGISSGLSHIDAERLGVPDTYLVNYLTYVDRYRAFIEMLTEILIEILLNDRELRIINRCRDGFMVEPGMEAVTYGMYMGGDLEPPTMLDHVVQSKPLTLQAATVLDISGSTEDLQEGLRGLVATLIEPIRRVQEKIITEPERYNWRYGDKMPSQLELSVFADRPEIILAMADVLTLPRVITKFNEMQKKGGGTNTAAILNFEYDRLMAHSDDQVVRVLTLVTDGEDTGSLLEEIVKKIIEDPRIYFLIVGIGPNQRVKDNIVNQYQKHLKPQFRYRFFADGFTSIELALMPIIKFFKMSLETERQKRDAMLRGTNVSGY